MSRGFTRTRHCRHNSFDRVARRVNAQVASGQPNDVHQFTIDQDVRLNSVVGGAGGIHSSLCLEQGDDESFTFEEIQAATNAADIGLSPLFPAQTTSIEFNGIDEAMRNQTQQSIGIGTVWSILINFRRRSDTQGLTQVNTILQLFGTATQNRIFIDANGAEANDPIVVETFGTNGALNKRFLWNSSIFPYDVWLQMLLVWNNSGTALTMYRNGLLVAQSSSTTNNSFTMNSTNRLIQIGANGGVQPYSGHIHSIALYNADVGSSAVELYNGGVVSSLDLNAASFAANLQHWWRLSLDPADLGKEYSDVSGNPINLVDLLNIDATDIDSESPL